MRPARRRTLRSLAALAFAASLGAVAQMEIGGRVLDLEETLKELNAKVIDREIRIALAADVLFDFDKHDLKPAAAGTLEKVAEVLKAHAGGAVLVEGHTDGKGNDAYNQALSERRAASVRDWLVKNASLPRSRFTTRGYGKARPVAPNAKADGSDDPKGRERNRRVEIVVRTA
jgi:outer membrane protein OmpA-like peptidoglycan-associated protein